MNQHTHDDKCPQRDVSLLYLTDCGEFNPQSGLFYNLDSKTLPELQYNWLTKQSNASSILMTLHELKFLELGTPKISHTNGGKNLDGDIMWRVRRCTGTTASARARPTGFNNAGIT